MIVSSSFILGMILVILMCVQVSKRICHFFERVVHLIFIQSNLHMRPPLVSDHLPFATAYPNHQNFPRQRLTVGISSKRLPPVSDRDHFSGLKFNDFPIVFTSCKRPLDAFSDLYVRCVHCAT